jgi:hypothetical protein
MTIDVEKAGLLLELSKKAYARFEGRQTMGWKLSIGLWLGFASGAGIVLQTNTSIPRWGPLIILGLVAVVLYGYWQLLITWMGRSNRRDIKSSYYWETAVSEVLDTPLSPCLAPNQEVAYKTWPEYPRDRETTGDPVETRPDLPGVLGQAHKADLTHFLITVILAILLFVAVCIRAFENKEVSPTTTQARLLMEGEIQNKVTIE